MTDLKRLLDDDSALGRDLLRAAEQVTPLPAAVLQRTLKRLELVPAAAAAPAVALPRVTLTQALVKWFASGVLLGGVSVAFGVGIVQPLLAPKEADAPRPLVSSPAALQSPLRSAPAEQSTTGESGVPAAPRPATSAAPASRAAASVGTRELGLGEEAEFVDAANRALTVRDASEGLRILGNYQRRFPAGQLTPEAELLRLQAFVMLGDFSRVELLSERLLREHPEGSYAARVRAVLHGTKERAE